MNDEVGVLVVFDGFELGFHMWLDEDGDVLAAVGVLLEGFGFLFPASVSDFGGHFEIYIINNKLA